MHVTGTLRPGNPVSPLLSRLGNPSYPDISESPTGESWGPSQKKFQMGLEEFVLAVFSDDTQF